MSDILTISTEQKEKIPHISEVTKKRLSKFTGDWQKENGSIQKHLFKYIQSRNYFEVTKELNFKAIDYLIRLQSDNFQAANKNTSYLYTNFYNDSIINDYVLRLRLIIRRIMLGWAKHNEHTPNKFKDIYTYIYQPRAYKVITNHTIKQIVPRLGLSRTRTTETIIFGDTDYLLPEEEIFLNTYISEIKTISKVLKELQFKLTHLSSGKLTFNKGINVAQLFNYLTPEYNKEYPAFQGNLPEIEKIIKSTNSTFTLYNSFIFNKL